MSMRYNNFQESEHPRGDDGKFIEKGRGAAGMGKPGRYGTASGKGLLHGDALPRKSASGGSVGKEGDKRSSPSVVHSVDYWERAGDTYSPSADAFASSFLIRAGELGIENLASSAQFLQGWLGALTGGMLLKSDTQYFYNVLRSMPDSVIGLSDDLAMAMYKMDKARTPEQQGVAVAEFLQTALEVFGPTVATQLSIKPSRHGKGYASDTVSKAKRTKEPAEITKPGVKVSLHRSDITEHGKGLISTTLKYQYKEYLSANNGKPLDAAMALYKHEFQGGHVKTGFGDTGIHNVGFTGRGKEELRFQMKNNPLKAELVQHLPDILRTGKYLGSIVDTADELGRHLHPNVKRFHYFTKNIQTSKGMRRVIIDVRELKTGDFVYDVYTLNYDGFKAYAAKIRFMREHGIKVETGNQGRYAVVSSHCQYPSFPVSDDNISQPEGLVNIFIVGED